MAEVILAPVNGRCEARDEASRSQELIGKKLCKAMETHYFGGAVGHAISCLPS